MNNKDDKELFGEGRESMNKPDSTDMPEIDDFDRELSDIFNDKNRPWSKTSAREERKKLRQQERKEKREARRRKRRERREKRKQDMFAWGMHSPITWMLMLTMILCGLITVRVLWPEAFKMISFNPTPQEQIMESESETELETEPETQPHDCRYDGHIFDSEPSCTEERVCTSCGFVESAVGHTYEDNVCIRCGLMRYSEGLEFISNGDGTCYVSGIGTCTDIDIVIPTVSPDNDAVTGVGNRAFYWLDHINSICVQSGVITIGDLAFNSCDKLSAIYLPETVESIGNAALCSAGIRSITVAEDNQHFKSVDGNLYSKDGKVLIRYASGRDESSFDIPFGVKTVERFAFWSSHNLVKVTMYSSVTGINDAAFSDCDKLLSIVIPKSVKSMGSSVFSSCETLVVFCRAESKPYGWQEDWNPDLRPVIWNHLGFEDGICEDGHTPGDEATCTEPQICIVCEYMLNPALGHSPGEEADCLNAQVCTVCGEVLNAELGHTPGEEADCTTAQTCTVCGEVLNAELGHTLGAEADCTHDQICTACGEVLDVALGHNIIDIPEQAPSCTEEGLTAGKKCDRCGVIIEAQLTVPLLGHTYDDEYDAICNVCGYVRNPACRHEYINDCDATCNLCGETRAISHAYESVYSNDDNNHWYECSVCGVRNGENKHIFTNVCDTTCNTCNYEREVSHSWLTNWTKDATGHWHKCAICGIAGDTSDHVYGSACDSKCDICSYTRTVDHIYADTYMNDATGHWYQCELCGNVTGKESHSWSFDCDTMCDVCYYLREVEHTWQTTYYRDTQAHWIACSLCGAKSARESHEWDNACDTSCNVCGYMRATSHSYSDKYSMDESSHWYTCEICGKETNKSVHTFSAVCDETCDACGYVRATTHTYENKVCIYCGVRQASEGLEFISNGDDTCYVSEIGTCQDTDIVIPATSPDGDLVTSIGNEAFRGCSNLTSITIPDGVTSIGDWAFYGCSGLTSINIPDGVTSIGNEAFYGCSGLTSINIPDSVTSIGFGEFRGCSSLTSITIPDSVTSMGVSMFWGCSNLTNITIPDGVTSIGGYAFRECSNLTNITIPDGVTSIGDYTFYGCSGLTSINIPDGVTSIGNEAFYGCSGLTSINIPDSVMSIGDVAFLGCSGLTSINIPDGVTSIGEMAFLGCSGLTSIYIPDSVTSIGEGMFANCSSLTIYCEAAEQPEGWADNWNPDPRPVVWGYKCADGHTYENGACIYCASKPAADPYFIYSAQDMLYNVWNSNNIGYILASDIGGEYMPHYNADTDANSLFLHFTETGSSDPYFGFFLKTTDGTDAFLQTSDYDTAIVIYKMAYSSNYNGTMCVYPWHAVEGFTEIRSSDHPTTGTFPNTSIESYQAAQFSLSSVTQSAFNMFRIDPVEYVTTVTGDDGYNGMYIDSVIFCKASDATRLAQERIDAIHDLGVAAYTSDYAFISDGEVVSTGIYSAQAPLTAPTITKEGYTLVGWKPESSTYHSWAYNTVYPAGFDSNTAGAKPMGGSVMFIAQWEPKAQATTDEDNVTTDG